MRLLRKSALPDHKPNSDLRLYPRRPLLAFLLLLRGPPNLRLNPSKSVL